MKLVVALLALCAACTLDHPAGTAEIAALDCYACHANDYANAPNHASQGRSTTCANCHRITDWVGLIDAGPHPEDKFPIATRGRHAGILCAECHDPTINPDSRVWTPPSMLEPALQPDNVVCTNCHAHEISRMAEQHHEVASYSATKCRGCHKLGLNED